jgi:HK97 family phage portal protein
MEDLHPEIRDRVHLMTGSGAEAASQSVYSYLSAITDYERHVWVRKAVLVIAQIFSALPLRVKRGSEQLSEHPLIGLLSNPNEKTSAADLWLQWVIDMELGGEEFWEFTRKPNGEYAEIWPRLPHTVSIVPDSGMVRYQVVSKYVVDDQKGPAYGLPPEEMLHFKFFNPRNPWRGIAPITAIRTSILIDVMAQAWSHLFFKKSARPDYALIAPQGLTPREREELELKLEQKFGGVDKAHKPIVLEEGVSDIKILSFPPKDMEWLEQRNMSREEVGSIFGVPDEIMGWGRDTYENFDTAERVLFTLTIQPLAGHRDIAVTKFFQKAGVLQPDESVVTDWSNVSALQQSLAEKLSQAQILFGMGYPQNVINERLGLGLPVLQGGEMGYLPIGLIPTTSTAEVKANISERGVSASYPIVRSRSPRTKAPAFGSEEHKTIWMQKDRRLNEDRKQLKRKLHDELERQEREVKRNLRELRGAPVPTRKGVDADEVFDVEAEVKRFKDEFLANLKGAVGHAGQAEMDALGVEMDFDLNRPEVQAAIKTLLKSFSEKINDTTYVGLTELFAQAEVDGLSIADIMERLDSYFDGRRSDASLERIARTTMTGANGAADVLAWEQSGVVDEREWLAALDDRTRADHRDAHGQRVTLDEPFEVDGEALDYPGDPNGSAENIVNCRCSQIGIVSEKRLRSGRSARRLTASAPTDIENVVMLIVSALKSLMPPASPGIILKTERVVIENPNGIQMDVPVLPPAVIENHILLPEGKVPTVVNEITVPSPEVKVAVQNTVEAATLPTIHVPLSVTVRRQSAKFERDALGRPKGVTYEDAVEVASDDRRLKGEDEAE